MDQRILELIGDLRRAGVRISPSESLDALTAAAEIDMGDRAVFKAALGTTLIKEGRDLGTFERLFDVSFPDARAFGEELGKALGREEAWIRQLIDRLLSEETPALDEISEILLRGREGEMDAFVGSPGLERLMCWFHVGDFSRRIYAGIDWGAIERDFGRIVELLEGRDLAPDELARIRRSLELRLEAFRRLVRRRVEHELERRACDGRRRADPAPLINKAFSALRVDEVGEMKAIVAQLARRIKDALATRQRVKRRGRLDARRTVRKNLQYGGVPMEMVLRQRRRDKPNMVTICDVSDSVGYASRFMLQLVWSLQECFARVRSYVFVSELAEGPQAFKRYPVEMAVEWALREAPVDYHGQSAFGGAFSEFAHAELSGLDSRTTILILGDARNNYHDPQEWALRRIRERVKGIIWLNPQGQREWGLADSAMPVYASCCNVLRECRTVRQLAEVVESLVGHRWRRRG